LGKKIIKALIVLTAGFLVCGYGYTGDLPQLGEKTRPKQPVQNIQPEEATPKTDAKYEFPQEKIFFPRINANYKLNKYSEYLADIKDYEPILASLKQVLYDNKPDKVQQFAAKVNVLDLNIQAFKQKYQNKPESNYESFKELVKLDTLLMETANYQRVSDKYRKDERGSLMDKLEDETYFRKNINASLKSIDEVLDIIRSAR